MIQSALRRTSERRDMVMRSLIRAVYRFRDTTLIAEKKDDFGNVLMWFRICIENWSVRRRRICLDQGN